MSRIANLFECDFSYAYIFAALDYCLRRCAFLKLGTHYPCPPSVDTSVKNDTGIHGPCVSRPVYTGSVYRGLVSNIFKLARIGFLASALFWIHRCQQRRFVGWNLTSLFSTNTAISETMSTEEIMTLLQKILFVDWRRKSIGCCQYKCR